MPCGKWNRMEVCANATNRYFWPSSTNILSRHHRLENCIFLLVRTQETSKKCGFGGEGREQRRRHPQRLLAHILCYCTFASTSQCTNSVFRSRLSSGLDATRHLLTPVSRLLPNFLPRSGGQSERHGLVPLQHPHQHHLSLQQPAPLAPLRRDRRGDGERHAHRARPPGLLHREGQTVPSVAASSNKCPTSGWLPGPRTAPAAGTSHTSTDPERLERPVGYSRPDIDSVIASIIHLVTSRQRYAERRRQGGCIQHSSFAESPPHRRPSSAQPERRQLPEHALVPV